MRIFGNAPCVDRVTIARTSDEDFYNLFITLNKDMMKKHIVFVLTILFCVSGFINIANAESDIDGWDKARFGMTRKQLSKNYIYKDKNYMSKSLQKEFALNEIIELVWLADLKFEGRFYFDKEGDEGKLNKILIFGSRDNGCYIPSYKHIIQSPDLTDDQKVFRILKVAKIKYEKLVAHFNSIYGQYDEKETVIGGESTKWKRERGELELFHINAFAISMTYKSAK